MKFLNFLTALYTLALYYRPRGRLSPILLWIPKLISGAMAPVNALIGVATGLYGLRQRHWTLVATGAATATLNAAHVWDVSRDRSHELFDPAFGPDWPQRIPAPLQANFMSRPYRPILAIPDDAIFQQNLIIGERYAGGPLLADLWQPKSGAYRSGVAIVYAHGGAWRYGNKDMMTRPQFRWLAHQGHVILDVEYSIDRNTPIQEMVRELKQAILWIKTHADAYGVDPQRVIVMGSSAGGHLALLTAYTPGHLAFRPAGAPGDETVAGVIALYPPADLLQLYQQNRDHYPLRRDDGPRLDPRSWFFYQIMHLLGMADTPQEITADHNFLTQLLGGTPEQVPDAYRLLSPSTHVSPNSPPTMLIIGEHDFFHFNPGVNQLHRQLRSIGVPSALLTFPRTDHAFDIVLTQISPVAQAALFHLERFLGILA